MNNEAGGTTINVKERGIGDFKYVDEKKKPRLQTEVSEATPDEKTKTDFPISAHH